MVGKSDSCTAQGTVAHKGSRACDEPLHSVRRQTEAENADFGLSYRRISGYDGV